MLVLCRKEQEQILIGDDIVVTVVDIDRGKVRIGIEAPKDVHILRGELKGTNYLNKGVDHVEAEQPVGQPQEELKSPFRTPQPGMERAGG